MYLVTGGGGFIGSHLVRALVQCDMQVRVLDNGSSGSRCQIADVLPQVEWIDGDIRDIDTVCQVCRGVDVIFHHAAIASVARSVADPEMTHSTNVTGTLHVLLAARKAGVRRVVFASSSSVYGNLPITPKTERMPVQPLSPYGVQKLAAEGYCTLWHTLYGIETVTLRYFNVFGPKQNTHDQDSAVIPRFISAVLEGHAPVIYGDGEQARDFIYIDDVVRVNMLAATRPEAAGKIINVGTGVRLTLNQLLAELSRISGQPVYPRYEQARPGDVRESLADISLMHAALGYKPTCSIAEGLSLTYSSAQAAYATRLKTVPETGSGESV